MHAGRLPIPWGAWRRVASEKMLVITPNPYRSAKRISTIPTMPLTPCGIARVRICMTSRSAWSSSPSEGSRRALGESGAGAPHLGAGRRAGWLAGSVHPATLRVDSPDRGRHRCRRHQPRCGELAGGRDLDHDHARTDPVAGSRLDASWPRPMPPLRWPPCAGPVRGPRRSGRRVWRPAGGTRCAPSCPQTMRTASRSGRPDDIGCVEGSERGPCAPGLRPKMPRCADHRGAGRLAGRITRLPS